MMHGRGRDEQIHVGNELPCAPHVGSDTGETFHDWHREGQHFKLLEKLTMRRQSRLGIGIAECALEDLSVRDDADPYAFAPHLL